MITNNESWSEVAVAYNNVPSHHLSERAEENKGVVAHSRPLPGRGSPCVIPLRQPRDKTRPRRPSLKFPSFRKIRSCLPPISPDSFLYCMPLDDKLVDVHYNPVIPMQEISITVLIWSVIISIAVNSRLPETVINWFMSVSVNRHCSLSNEPWVQCMCHVVQTRWCQTHHRHLAVVPIPGVSQRGIKLSPWRAAPVVPNQHFICIQLFTQLGSRVSFVLREREGFA